MEKLRFSKQFIQFIILLYNDTQALITNNEYVSKPFNIGRGVRQRCPLSLLLYIIYGKLINANIKNNDKIQGLKILNRKDIKISQFVDDTNFITINEEFIIEIKNFLTKYGKALNKTIIIELANTKIYNLQNKLTNFKIMKNNELFKILGIYFFKDLQFTSKNNWIICVQKTENQINLLSKRKVSLRGKAIILNSFVLSKAQFLSNLFLIPKQLEKQLHKLIFKYTWFYENIKPISKKNNIPSKRKRRIRNTTP